MLRSGLFQHAKHLSTCLNPALLRQSQQYLRLLNSTSTNMSTITHLSANGLGINSVNKIKLNPSTLVRSNTHFQSLTTSSTNPSTTKPNSTNQTLSNSSETTTTTSTTTTSPQNKYKTRNPNAIPQPAIESPISTPPPPPPNPAMPTGEQEKIDDQPIFWPEHQGKLRVLTIVGCTAVAIYCVLFADFGPHDHVYTPIRKYVFSYWDQLWSVDVDDAAAIKSRVKEELKNQITKKQ